MAAQLPSILPFDLNGVSRKLVASSAAQHQVQNDGGDQQDRQQDVQPVFLEEFAHGKT